MTFEDLFLIDLLIHKYTSFKFLNKKKSNSYLRENKNLYKSTLLLYLNTFP